MFAHSALSCQNGVDRRSPASMAISNNRAPELGGTMRTNEDGKSINSIDHALLEKFVGKQLSEEYMAIKERRKALEAAKGSK